MIISPQYEKIHRILLENETGVTLFPIETGYTGEKQKAILCAVSSRRLPRIKQLVEGGGSHRVRFGKFLDGGNGKRFYAAQAPSAGLSASVIFQGHSVVLVCQGIFTNFSDFCT